MLPALKPPNCGQRSRHCCCSKIQCDTSTSTSSGTKLRAAAGVGKPTSLGAKELVEIFKTMSYPMLLRPTANTPPQSPSPTRPPEGDDDDGFTVFDCMSIFFGAGDGGGERKDNRHHWRESETLIKLDAAAALNTVAARGEGDIQTRRRQRQRRRERERQHRCRHRHGHHRSGHRRRNSSRRAGSRGSQPPGPRHHCSQRPRRCFGSFECIATDPPDIHEAKPTAPVVFERAAARRQDVASSAAATAASCRLFRSTECPQLRWALPARRLPELISPSAVPSPTQPQPRPQVKTSTLRRCHRSRTRGEANVVCGGGGCGASSGVWFHRGASSNCNAEDKPHVNSLRPLHRRRLLRHCRVGEDSSDESSILISESIVSSPVGVTHRGRRRHLLTPPLRPCHRVRVPPGASSGRQPSGNSGHVCSGLTRTATRTARSVGRQVRDALCNRRRRTEQSPSLPPPPLQHAQTLPPQLLTTSPPRLPTPRQPDSNNNRQEDFGCLLHPLDSAQLHHGRSSCKRRTPRWPERNCMELVLDRPTDAGTLRARGLSESSQSSESEDSMATAQDDTETSSSTEQFSRDDLNASAPVHASQSDSAPPAPLGAALRLPPPPPTLPPPPPGPQRLPVPRRKVELINAMSNSLLGLSQNLQGCVDHIQLTLAQLRRDGRR